MEKENRGLFLKLGKSQILHHPTRQQPHAGSRRESRCCWCSQPLLAVENGWIAVDNSGWSLCDGPVNTVLNFLCRSVMLSWFGLGYFGLSVEQLLLSFSRLCVKKYFWFESVEMGK